jgi:hypothetical protein
MQNQWQKQIQKRKQIQGLKNVLVPQRSNQALLPCSSIIDAISPPKDILSHRAP